ncbi:ATP-binding cassette (ABC) Superfamily, partial [Phytophthora palmivora]
MPKKASTRGASAPSKSKTARSKAAKGKSKDKATPRKEARKAASEAGSKRTAAAASQEGGAPRARKSARRLPRQAASARPLPPDKKGVRDDRPNPRFAYRDHRPGSESPEFHIPIITGSESDEDSPGSAKDPPSSQDAPSQDTQSSPAKNLTLTEGKARAQVAKAASATRADEAPGSPTSEPSIAKGFKSLFDSSDEDEEEGAVSEPREISNDLDEQQERYQAAQLQGTPVPPTPAARCVLLAPHRIPLKEFTSLRKKPEGCGGLFLVWGYPRVQPENTTTQTQAED